MIALDLRTFIDGHSASLLAAFVPERFTRKVVEDEDGENLPTEILYTSKADGLEVHCDEAEIIRTIFIHSAGHDGYEGYVEPVAGVEFSWDRQRVRARLGVPTISDEAGTLPIPGVNGGWDRYDSPACCIHVEFHRTEPRVELITLMSPATAP